jgi:ribose 5-phosphate isomerase B
MSTLSDTDLHDLVQRIVRRTLAVEEVVESNPPGKTSLKDEPDLSPEKPRSNVTTRRIAIGADHGGFSLKENLKPLLQRQGYQVDDCGTHSSESVDYPDYAYAVAQKVSKGEAWRGIIIDGAGIGSCMVANKVPGVRAGMCYDNATAINSREHNNANVLTLGAGMIETNVAHQIVLTWLITSFAGGRHARRVDKIMNIEKFR